MLFRSVEQRIHDAADFESMVSRRQHLIGLVPIIDKTQFIADNPVAPNGRYTTAPKLILTIKYFGYYEIEDIVEKNSGDGYVEALDKPNYVSNGLSSNYSLPKGSIVGEFIIEGIADIDVVMNKDDQDLVFDGDRPATYIKLIK